jgi:hypothetical protein
MSPEKKSVLVNIGLVFKVSSAVLIDQNKKTI